MSEVSNALRPQTNARALYLGLFAVAATTLMHELLLTRILSVIAWYHLAFFVISLGMLGMTAGAIVVFLRPEYDVPEAVGPALSRHSLRFAASAPLAGAGMMAIPLEPVVAPMDFVTLLIHGALLAVPFTQAGVVLTLALTKTSLPAARTYAVDLLGAALGCVAVLPLLRVFDAPSGVLLASGLAALGGLVFARASGIDTRPAAALAGLLIVAGLGNAALGQPYRPAWVKGGHEDPRAFERLEWNSFSRVSVETVRKRIPPFWAASVRMPPELLAPLESRLLRIDGAAATEMVTLGAGVRAHPYLRYDLTAFAHELRPTGPAAVIGVGGGRDILTAVLAGHDQVVGLEVNERIVDLHYGPYRDISGLATLPEVELVTDEARSWLRRNDREFSVITMSLIDTWAATGAGAYALSENGLYTVEAFRIMARRLRPDGILSVSRWYHQHAPGETARLLALMKETAWSFGVDDPRQHIIIIQWGQIATAMLSPRPWTKRDLERVTARTAELGFYIMAAPGVTPHAAVIADVWNTESSGALAAIARANPLDLSPPTDDRPFFFNMVRPSTWLTLGRDVQSLDVYFLGNFSATSTLIYATLASLLLTVLTCLVPLLARAQRPTQAPMELRVAAVAYFAAIGLGFMFVEIGMLSRLSVFLGHPMLALSVLLAGMISAAGVGSLASGQISVEHPAARRFFPLIPIATTVAAVLVVPGAMAHFGGATVGVRAAVAWASVSLPALGMGICFPLGLRLLARSGPDAQALSPWLWGINGAAGVLASGTALVLSMSLGITVTLWVGVACYVSLLATAARLSR